MNVSHAPRKFLSPILTGLLTAALLALALSFLPASAIQARPATEDAIEVGVVLPTVDQVRWQQDAARLQATLDAAGYSYAILFSEDDTAVEKANVEALIAQGMQVLIICPTDSGAAAQAVETARQAGVKVISYDRLIRDTAAIDYYVTFDSIDVGGQQGQYLVDQAASGADHPLYLYAGAAGDNNAFLFFEGAWNVLQPKIAGGTFAIKNSSEAVALQHKAALTREEQARIIDQITTGWDWDIAQSLAAANLAAVTAADKGDVFILSPNDGAARAIAEVFTADPDVHSYVNTGQDADQDSVQHIIDGKQSMTVFKDIRTLATDATAAAATFMAGGAPVATKTYNNGLIDVPSKPSAVITVDANNVRPVLIDSGYYQLDDFQWPVVAAQIPPSGGAITSQYDTTTYVFPSGAFASEVIISHTIQSAVPVAAGLAGIGHGFDVAAVFSGTGQPAAPAMPYSIVVEYSDAQIGVLRESTLALYYWAGDRWIKEPTIVAVEANKVSATTSRFGTFAVLAELPKVFLPMLRR